MTTIVGLSGSLTHPSRTTTLVERVLDEAARRDGVRTELIHIADLAPVLGLALDPRALPESVAHAHRLLAEADALVIASPIYKASYSGLLKHFLDLVDPAKLAGKAVLLAATGGSERHALALDHQFRPLAAFFGLRAAAAGLYVTDGRFAKHADGGGYGFAGPDGVTPEIDRAVAELLRLAGHETAPLAAIA